MIPYGLLFHRLTQRYQEDTMTCTTPCNNCQCEPASIYNHDYVEFDASPMATQQSRYIADLQAVQAKANYWDVFCVQEPSAPECKIHDN